MRKAKAMPMPRLDNLVNFLGQHPCVISTVKRQHEDVSTMTTCGFNRGKSERSL
jgi:hypothetical protein